MRPLGKNKPKTISARLKETREFIQATPEQMAFILDQKEQIYKLYEKGNFDKTYSLKQERVAARLVFLDAEIDKKIKDLQVLKGRYENYGKENGKFLPVSLDNGTSVYAPRKYKSKKKIGKKSGKNLTLKQDNLQEKALKD